jgi:DNA-binding Lrp family transcriptional regulator
MKTIYITEEQKKKLKKAITPQEQVGKKVNAGVMDAVVGGMCEDAEDDKFVLGAEMNAPIGGVYYHVKESKLNESPDYIDFFDDRFNYSDAYPFIYLWNKQQLYIGQGGQTHIDVVNEIDKELNNDFSNPEIPYSAHCDEMLTGRYWQQDNVISFWKTPIDRRMNVRKVIDALKEQGIIQSSEYTVLDYWDNNTMSCCIFPIKWLFNGTYDMFAGRCSRIAPIKPLEYSRTGKYTYFQVNTNGSGIQCVNVSGNEILTGMEYYMKTSSMSEGRKKVVKNDEGEIVPEKCDKCGGDVVVQIHGEPVYICKDCGKYFGTVPFTLKESIDYKKWLRQLKKRRDPDNIEENIEIEDKWNGEGEKLEPLKRISRVPEFLYHCSYAKNRESILKNGIYASVGDEYKDWWNYEGPNGETPDDDELEYLVFLSSRPYTWADNYPIDKMDIYKIDTKQLDKHCFYFDPDRFMALKGSICYTLNIPPSAIELFDTVYRHKSIKENIENEIAPEDVDLSSFNIKKRLNPKFWSDGHLDSRIRLKLMDISNDFIEYLGIEPNIVEDVLMTGSLANFNWSEEFSDIDLHILLDYSDVDENTEFVKQYFMSQKNSWNNEHGDITIFGFPVEVYVQDINEKHDSSGVYSLDRDKWLIEPDRNILATSKVNKKLIKDKVSDYTNKIDKLVYLYGKAKDDEYKLGKIAEKANVLWDEIKNSRKKGFEISNGKEINNFNIIFKTLRRFGYLDKLYQLKTKTYNKLNSID